MNNNTETLANKLQESFSQHLERNAIYVDGSYYQYYEINNAALTIANVIKKSPGLNSKYISFFCSRIIHSYTAIAGILISGHAYLPLNPKFPPNRLHQMLENSKCNTIILSEECAEYFFKIENLTEKLYIICPEPGNLIMKLKKIIKNHSFVFPQDSIQKIESIISPTVLPEDPAYLLFTSGTTGIPKGIPVSHANVCTYLNYTIKKYKVSPDDRISQMFDITFDLSVHDIFVSFLSGACLYIIPDSSIMAPAKFIKEHKLTLWFSVPSVAMFMEKMRMLKPSSFPTLRYSLFCGEAMPKRSAEAWQIAANNSIIENLYGPTETTIAITSYRWDTQISPEECINGIVPIGWPFDSHFTHILFDDENVANIVDKGELCLAGPQVTSGYINDPSQTSERFIYIGNDGKRWYRTGDIVRQGKNKCLFYLGRTDDQLQIRGYRAELQEIDQVIRKVAGTDLAISVPKLLSPGQAETVYAFIQGKNNEFSIEEILQYCRQNLPEYMVPTEIIFIDKIPVNVNGKINRKALMEKI